jgi:hypothetical protein
VSVKQRERVQAIIDRIRRADGENINWRREVEHHGDVLEGIARDRLERADDVLRQFEEPPIPESQVLDEIATMTMLVWVSSGILAHPLAQSLGRDRCEP